MQDTAQCPAPRMNLGHMHNLQYHSGKKIMCTIIQSVLGNKRMYDVLQSQQTKINYTGILFLTVISGRVLKMTVTFSVIFLHLWKFSCPSPCCQLARALVPDHVRTQNNLISRSVRNERVKLYKSSPSGQCSVQSCHSALQSHAKSDPRLGSMGNIHS